jgi:hypothetical protein
MELEVCGTFDSQASFVFGDGKYRVVIWGKNVTAAFYVTNRSFSFDGVAQYMGKAAT